MDKCFFCIEQRENNCENLSGKYLGLAGGRFILRSNIHLAMKFVSKQEALDFYLAITCEENNDYNIGLDKKSIEKSVITCHIMH